MAKSKPEPDLGNHAGERETVVFRLLHFKLELVIAVLTRSRDSFNAASGNPSSVKDGSPSEISTSTVINSPTSPTNAIVWLLKTAN
jgi:hypothetical protein